MPGLGGPGSCRGVFHGSSCAPLGGYTPPLPPTGGCGCCGPMMVLAVGAIVGLVVLML